MIVKGGGGGIIIRKDLSESELTLVAARDTEIAIELADKNAHEIQRYSTSVQTSLSINKFTNMRPTNEKASSRPQCDSPSSKQQVCFRCGYFNHSSASFKHKTYKCNQCSKIGHLQSQCGSRGRNEKVMTKFLCEVDNVPTKMKMTHLVYFTCGIKQEVAIW